jgi:hypothetical protein
MILDLTYTSRNLRETSSESCSRSLFSFIKASNRNTFIVSPTNLRDAVGGQLAKIAPVEEQIVGSQLPGYF